MLSSGFPEGRNDAGEKNRVTFDSVAGVDEEKEELQEIVEFLKNPKDFYSLETSVKASTENFSAGFLSAVLSSMNERLCNDA